jgi:hypothetical protein
MKTKTFTLFITVMILFLVAVASAQVPQKINYQGVARNSAGVILSNTTLGLRFSIHETTAAGAEIFAETNTVVTNDYGGFTAEIGGGTPVTGTFVGINWGSGPKFLQIKMDPNGGTSYLDMGTYQMFSVAYAQYAKDVLNNNDADYDPTNELQTLSISGNQLSISNGNSVTLPGGGSAPGGTNGTVQFNSGGVFGGDAGLFWDNTNKRLGIGSSTPRAGLEISQNSTITAPQLLLNETEGDYARLSFQNSLTANKYWSIAGLTNATDNLSLLNFYYNNGTLGNDILSINGNGNVGVGMYSPPYKLSVFGGTGTSEIHFSNGASGTTSGDGLRIGLSSAGANTWVWNNENGRLYFGTNNLERMSISADGKIGIATATPTATLEVDGTVKTGVNGVAYSEIMEVTGTTGGASTGWIQISYPAGYTLTNIRVLSLEINYLGNSWVGLSGCANPTTDIQKVFYYLGSTQIWIYYPNNASFQSKAFRMLVMKL